MKIDRYSVSGTKYTGTLSGAKYPDPRKTPEYLLNNANQISKCRVYFYVPGCVYVDTYGSRGNFFYTFALADYTYSTNNTIQLGSVCFSQGQLDITVRSDIGCNVTSTIWSTTTNKSLYKTACVGESEEITEINNRLLKYRSLTYQENNLSELKSKKKQIEEQMNLG